MSRIAAVTCLVFAGCCQTPAYLEPQGHSTTYRRHAERFDAAVVAAMPVIVVEEGEPIGDAEPLPIPIDGAASAWPRPGTEVVEPPVVPEEPPVPNSSPINP